MIPDGWSIAAPSIGDWIPLDFVAVIKCLLPDGSVGLVHTITPDLNQWEAVGMVDALDGQIRWAFAEDDCEGSEYEG